MRVVPTTSGISMEWLAALGGGAFVLVSLAVGTRLLLLARRTRQLPEFAMGGALLLMGGIGYPAIAIARGGEALDPGLRCAIAGFAMLCQAVGIAGLAAFTAQVFRAEQAAARFAAWAIAALALGTVVAEGMLNGFQGAVGNIGLPMRGNEAMAGIVLGWCMTESFAYYAKLKRRVGLGLATPVVANRIKLWTIGAGFAMLLNVTSQIAAWNGIDVATSTLGAILIGSLGPVAAGTIWLAFFPPAAYLRRIEGAAESAHG